MKSLRSIVESHSCVRAISWKIRIASIAGAILTSMVAHAESPVAVPSATVALLAQQRAINIHWAAFQLLALAIPLLFLFTGLGARVRRMCESISGHRWFWTVTLFACAYLILAALIALPVDFYINYWQQHAAGHSGQTLLGWLKGEGAALVIQLVPAALLVWIPYLSDRQKSAPLVALLRAGFDSVRLSGSGGVACVDRSADDEL